MKNIQSICIRTRSTIQSLIIICFVSLITISCSEQKNSSSESSTNAQKEKALEQFFYRQNEAAQAGDKTAYVNLFLPDASLFLPHRSPIIGHEAIGKWFDEFKNEVTLVTNTYEQEKIDIVGDIAVVRSRGTGHYLVNDTQEQIPLKNQFVDVLKYKEGEWKLVYHLVSSYSFEPGYWD